VLAQSGGGKREIACALNALAQLERVEGHPEKTEPLYLEMVRLMREVGDLESAAIGLLNLAMVCITQGNGEAAGAMVGEALATAEQTQSRPVTQSVLEVCAGLAALRRDWPRAAQFFGAAEAHARSTGVRRDPADEAFLAPRMELARAALGKDRFLEAESQGLGLDHGRVLRETHAWLQPSLEAAAATQAVKSH